MLNKALDVRHDVFVREKGFEKYASCQHDAHALHIVFNCGSHSAGSVRLILANPQRQDYLFPCQQAFQRMNKKVPFKEGISSSLLGETSRLAVLSDHRSTGGHAAVADALVLASFAAIVKLGLPGCYILVENRLVKHLRAKVRLTVEELAGPVYLNGQRYAYWVPGSRGEHSFDNYPVGAVFAWANSQLAPFWPQIKKTELVRGLAVRLSSSEQPKKIVSRGQTFRLAAA